MTLSLINMFEIDKFIIDGKTFQGVKSTLPELPPLLLIKGDKGFVMCGYLNLEVAERLGAAAAIVSGVNELGVKPGKVVNQVISKLG
jgi:uncharacterized protein YunC (DUF1805 family)